LKSKTIIRCCFIALVLAFCYGLTQLFLLRFETGDVYPPYSSLRSDPLGTRALHESLMLVNPASVSRNFNPLSDLHFEENTSYMFLGTPVFDPEAVSEDQAETIDNLTAAGGRLVMAFLPVGDSGRKCLPCEDAQQEDSASPDGVDSEPEPTPDQNRDSAAADEKTESQKSDADEEPADEHDPSPGIFKTVSLKESWGVSFQYDETTAKQRRASVNVESDTESLPSSFSWHSTLYFGDLDESWRVLYHQNGQPVIVERPYKRGSILLCADSFVFSNEALRAERLPELLTRLIGPHNQVVFDEAHLGIYKVPGVAGLIRRFGFHWFFLTIALLFFLFIWKNSAPFVPPPVGADDGFDTNADNGRDYAQGLMSLLRRNISAKNILAVSVAEWKKTCGHAVQPGMKPVDQTTVVNKVEDAVERNPADPLKAYNTICKLLSKRN